MLAVQKLVNFKDDHVFYLSNDSSAIEIYLANVNLIINYVGNDFEKKISTSYASFTICRDENKKIYTIFDDFYNNIKKEYDLMISKGIVGEISGLDSIMCDEKIVCTSDDSIYGNVNKLIVEPSDNAYIIHFVKGLYLDGRYNRSFKIKINLVNGKLFPFSRDFKQLYNELLNLEDINKVEQNSYNLSKLKKW